MKGIFIVLIFATFILSGTGHARYATTASEQMSTPTPVEEHVIEAEKEVWNAARTKDARRFNELVADDARMVFDSGVFTKAEYLRSLPDRTITEFQLADFLALRPNSQIVILIYKASRSGAYKGKPFPSGTVRESSVWVNRGGKWVAVLNQETPVAR